MENLFGSKTRTKLLKLFMNNPNRSFFVREITRKIEEQINSVRRELANLLSLGVITSDSSDSTNNKLYYEVNQTYEHYNALRELFTGKKAPTTTTTKTKKKKSDKADDDANKPEAVEEKPAQVTKSDVDSKIWDKVGNISGLIYSGAFTRDSLSPVDVLVVGDVTVARVEAAVAELEKQENKELRYAIIEVDEWKYRRQVNDKFLVQVMQAKNQVILDKDSLFEQK